MSTTTVIRDLPAGLSTRPVQYLPDGSLDPSDAADLLAVIHRVESTALGASDTTLAELGEMAAGPDVRREQSQLVVDSAGAAVGAVWYEVDDESRGVWCDAYVPPQDDGLLRMLMRHSIEVARGIVGDRAGWRIRSGLLAAEAEHAGTLQNLGFRRVRRFWRMEIESSSPAIPATAPPLPAGVTIDVGDDEAHKRAVYDVDQAAFVDHWDFTPRSYDEAWRHLLAEPGARGEYWWLLRVHGDPAAICLLGDSRRERGYAYVSSLGVRREYRRRGLAQLLLRRVFVAARDQGLAGTALHVDSQNPTGATRLYESVGMHVSQEFEEYELLAPA